MLKNYLRAAWRSLLAARGYSVLNVLGLATGIAASILILAYVVRETSYDDFHEKGDRIYRVRYDYFRGDERVFKSASAFPRVGPAMKEDFPEVEEYARVFLRHGGGIIRVGEKSFREDDVFNADSSFFGLFSYPLLKGDPATALAGPNKAVIAEDVAGKYFGDANPIGKRIRFGDSEEYEITGVARSPENSHLKFTFLFSYETLVQQWGAYVHTNWGWYDFYNYILLKPGADASALEAKLPAFVSRHNPDKEDPQRVRFSLQPLASIHLNSDLLQEARPNGDARSVLVLGLIAILVIVIAWVNYINLATARAMKRAREIGIRKVVGAHRGQLVTQFLLESITLNLLSGIAALVIAVAALPTFNRLAGAAIDLALLQDPLFWMGYGAFFLAGSIASGLYPAIVLSGFRPAYVLHGGSSKAPHGAWLRKALVVGQFVASVGLMAATLVIFQQLQFMRHQDLGVDIEQKLLVRGPGFQVDSLDAERVATFRQELLSAPSIHHVSASSEIPGNLIYWTNDGRRLGSGAEEPTTIYKVGVDHEFLTAYGHEAIAGRTFARDFATDEDRVILSRSAAATMGFATPEHAVGETVVVGNDSLEVLGVVADFHQEGLQKGFDPIAFFLMPNVVRYITLDVAAGESHAALEHARETHKALFPDEPFTYFFLDDHFDQQYASFDRFGRVFGVFTSLAILVACLGLFGLSSFATSQRTKEIGIRKVLGAPVSRIILLVSKDHLSLVVVAGILTIPLVWIAMQRWLEGFAFHIEIQWWMFGAAIAAAFVVAGLTVGVHTLRAALANPVDSLRYE